MVPRAVMWLNLSWRWCCIGADGPPRVVSWPGLGGEPTSLPRILSCHHMERYSYEGPDMAGYKVGPVGPGVGQPVALLGPPSCGFSLWGPQGQRLTVVTLV
jgi:hypothetical protein